MWADAQRYGRPAEYRWRPLLNVVDQIWMTSVERRRGAVTKARCKTRLNLLEWSKLANGSQPKFTIWWGRVEEILLFNKFLHFAWVVDDAKCIVVTRVCVSVCVCLSAAVRPHYCTDPDVTWGRGRGYPLVVHYWADLQSGHGLRCYGNITRTLVPSLRPSRDMTT